MVDWTADRVIFTGKALCVKIYSFFFYLHLLYYLSDLLKVITTTTYIKYEREAYKKWFLMYNLLLILALRL